LPTEVMQIYLFLYTLIPPKHLAPLPEEQKPSYKAAQNKTNLEIAKAENDVIFLDAKDKEVFATYDPDSPESLIALKIQQSKYLEGSLYIGNYVEDNL
jgi:hypothetical protein